jgi:hypothetical protein
MTFSCLRTAAILLLLGTAVAQDSAPSKPTPGSDPAATEQTGQQAATPEPTKEVPSAPAPQGGEQSQEAQKTAENPSTTNPPGQQPTQGSPAATPSAPGQEKSLPPLPGEREGHERVAFVVPAFIVTNNPDAPPLTKKEKFVLFARSAFDWWPFIATGVEAGISQANNEFPEYGQGAEGYFKRYGASFTDSVDSNFMSNFAWSVILREDPRYFRVQTGPVFKHRLTRSVIQEIWCKTDKATKTICWENILGAFSSGSISNLYYPDSSRGFGLTMNRSAVALGYGAAGNIAVEFWPDIERWLFRKRIKREEAAADSSTKQSQ